MLALISMLMSSHVATSGAEASAALLVSYSVLAPIPAIGTSAAAQPPATKTDASTEMPSDCARLIEKIDRLLTIAKLDPTTGPRIVELLEQGKELHAAGDPGCLVPLQEAARLLGIS